MFLNDFFLKMFCLFLEYFFACFFFFFSLFLECKVWRNPLNLLRGAEYQRFTWETDKEPLTYYDMNLSAQDHQTFFTCDSDAGKQEYESKDSVHCFVLPLLIMFEAQQHHMFLSSFYLNIFSKIV